MSGCAAPLTWETLVAYWADDLAPAEVDAVDAHLMSCASCSDSSSRVAQLTQGLRELIPPLLTAALVSRLVERGLRVVDNLMQPGERREVWFPAEVDVMVHRLSGLDLSEVRRLSVRIRDEASGNLLAEVPDGAFDRERGEVWVACQQHYAHMPPNTVFDLELSFADGSTREVAYTVLHRFAPQTSRV
jgi:hypothetical protein